MVSSIHTEYFQGQYREIILNIVDAGGDPVDLTSADYVKWAAAPTENDAAVLNRSWPASGITMVNAVLGMASVVISGVTIAAGTYYQEIIYSISDQVTVAAVGTIHIRPTII